MNPGSPSPSDEDLACRSQAGSASAFEELVCRYETRIYRFVSRLCADERDAREITQDVFVSAYQALGRFDAGRSFPAWLFTIARRKAIDRLRAFRPAVDPLPDLPDLDDPANQLGRREARDNLWNVARACLPDLQFQALWLMYAEDLSVAEIAQVLHRTRTHVKVLLFRGRAALGRRLNELPSIAAFAAAAPVSVPGPLLGKGFI